MPLGVGFIGMADAEDGDLVKRLPDNLQGEG